jgi:hypothetical protein
MKILAEISEPRTFPSENYICDLFEEGREKSESVQLLVNMLKRVTKPSVMILSSIFLK